MKDVFKEVYKKVKFEWGMSDKEIRNCLIRDFKQKEKVE